MLNDFDLIVHKLPEGATIYPISDVHYGALEHNEKEWQAFLHKVQEDKNAYVILNGDLINNSIRTSVANPFDEVCRPREQKRQMTEYLAPIRDRILCCTSGNHEYRTSKETDQDLTYDIMSKLDIENLYRPNIAFMKLQVGQRPDAENRFYQSYCFAVSHGTGGGVLTGATVNRNERFANIIDGLDCLIVGHTHKGTVTKPSKIVIDANNNVVTTKSMVVISSVSWLNYGGYAARKMLLPAEVCNPMKLHLASTCRNHDIEVVW